MLDNLRNTIAHRLANFVLLLATRNYRLMVEGAIRYGLNAAARDAREGIPPPPHYSHTETP